MVDSPWILFVLPFRHVLQHHFKKKLSHQIQYWLRINCGRAFAWEMIYPLESSNSSGGRNILLIKRCFYFWRALLVITYPLFMIILLCPPIYLYPPKRQDHKKFWRFYQGPPPPPTFFRGGWCHGNVMTLSLQNILWLFFETCISYYPNYIVNKFF